MPLARRVEAAKWDWYIKAHPIFDSALAEIGFDAAQAAAKEEFGGLVDDLIETIGEHIEGLRAKVHELLPDDLGRDCGVKGTLSKKLRPIEIPEVDLAEPPDPLVSSDMDLADHISVLRVRKDYSGSDDDDDCGD